MSNFPASLDSYTTKNNGDVIDSSHVDNLQDAVVALETKVGADSSAVTTTLDYLIKSTSSSDPGHKHTVSSLSDFNISSPSSGQILSYSGSKIVNSSTTFKFGGSGSDGALSISSGTTTIDCANAAVVVKNYTSISITGTGKLAFSNPHSNGTTVILKSQGAVTLTSSQAPMIDMSSMGALGGSQISTSLGGGSHTDANAGTNGITFTAWTTNGGTAGAGSSGSPGSNSAGAAISSGFNSTNLHSLAAKYPRAFVGAGGTSGSVGGGSGSTASVVGGAGGRGGGSLIIECGGAWNFTTSGGISVAGGVGGTGSASGGTNPAGGGGGGGAGGYFNARYNTLTANSGTVTVSGGNGGTGTNSGGGGAGSAITTGSAASSATGGNGASGLSDVAQNTEFA